MKINSLLLALTLGAGAAFANPIDQSTLTRSQDITASLNNAYFANFNSMNERMSELRNLDTAHGIWARVSNGSYNNKFSNTSSNITTLQLGYDYAFGLGKGKTNYLGAALSYGFGYDKFKNSYNTIGFTPKMNSNLIEFVVYNSYIQEDGWFNDTILKLGSLMNEISATDINVDTNSFTFTLADEFGYRFKLGKQNEWYVDPKLSFGIGYVDGSSFDQLTDSRFVTTKNDSLFMIKSRIGATAGYDAKRFITDDRLKASLYVGLYAEVDGFFGSDSTASGLTFTTTKLNTLYKASDIRGVVVYGTNVELKDKVRVYLDMEHSFGGKLSSDYKVSAGIRYSFGEKKDYTKSTETSKNPVKLKEDTEEELF